MGPVAAVRSSVRAGRPAAAVVLALLAVTGCTDSGAAGQDVARSAPTSSSGSAAAPSGAAGQLQSSYEQVIAQVLPSVVEIRSSTGLGSGIVYDGSGNIVTNAHVVGSDKQFQVLTSGSAVPLQATLVGSYPPNDVAVVRVAGGQGLKPAAFGDSNQVKVGELVLAMGNPLGLSATVTDGIVSAVGRTVSEPASANSSGATLPETIQTSAAINPGNSGGALVDLQGQVIGIPTLAAVDPQAGGAAPGIGFAIPSNSVKFIADQLVATGTATHSGRAALGVRVTTVTDRSGRPQGVGVIDVTPGGPADQAGIRPGDVIVAVDDQSTPTTQALTAVLAGRQVGQAVAVTIEREGNRQDVKATLGEL